MGTAHSITFKNTTIHGINNAMDRKNINIAFGSCGVFHSGYFSCKQAQQISADDYERLDQLHYKIENALRKLIESLQKKQTDKQWEDRFHSE